MKLFGFALTLLLASPAALAAELDDEVTVDHEQTTVVAAPSAKRTYPGGADEEDLKVQAHLPEAVQKTDSQVVTKEVYKTLYNEEMKAQSAEPPEE